MLGMRCDMWTVLSPDGATYLAAYIGFDERCRRLLQARRPHGFQDCICPAILEVTPLKPGLLAVNTNLQ